MNDLKTMYVASTNNSCLFFIYSTNRYITMKTLYFTFSHHQQFTNTPF